MSMSETGDRAKRNEPPRELAELTVVIPFDDSDYDENGVDLSLIRANLRLTPTERARRAERARRSALRVQEIGRASRNQPA